MIRVEVVEDGYGLWLYLNDEDEPEHFRALEIDSVEEVEQIKEACSNFIDNKQEEEFINYED